MLTEATQARKFLSFGVIRRIIESSCKQHVIILLNTYLQYFIHLKSKMSKTKIRLYLETRRGCRNPMNCTHTP